jgi:hypothetical protein
MIISSENEMAGTAVGRFSAMMAALALSWATTMAVSAKTWPPEM